MNDSDATSGPYNTVAAKLHALYFEELTRALLPPVHPMVNGDKPVLPRESRVLPRSLPHTSGDQPAPTVPPNSYETSAPRAGV